jgi:hypothetical protein
LSDKSIIENKFDNRNLLINDPSINNADFKINKHQRIVGTGGNVSTKNSTLFIGKFALSDFNNCDYPTSKPGSISIKRRFNRPLSSTHYRPLVANMPDVNNLYPMDE